MRLVCAEFGRVPRHRLTPVHLTRLRRLDVQQFSLSGRPIFDWNDNRWLRVQNYVGVLQVRGLTIEILPKICGPDDPLIDPQPSDDHDHSAWKVAQGNLLYMLSVAGHLPFQERELANLQTRKLPLIEVLIAAFAQRLLRELRRGLDRSYIRREENLAVVKGKLLIAAHIKHNAVRRDRVFVAHEDFVSDTPINRILKATCRRLLPVAAMPSTQQRLRECLIDLGDVEDEQLRPEAFAAIHYTRNSERYEPLIQFCRMVMEGTTPIPGGGGVESISLLFPMETLFEEFIGQLLRKHAVELGLTSQAIVLQAVRSSRWLVHEHPNRGRFLLKPDILIKKDHHQARIIIDTKWKRLATDDLDAKNNVSQADMYQMFAYAHRFDCMDNVLLFPDSGTTVRKRYHIPGTDPARGIRIETVNLLRSLPQEKTALLDELKQILHGGRIAQPTT